MVVTPLLSDGVCVPMVVLAGVTKRLAMPKRRIPTVEEPFGLAETCAVCGGLYRAVEPLMGRYGMCPGCKSQAAHLAGVGDPRATA